MKTKQVLVAILLFSFAAFASGFSGPNPEKNVKNKSIQIRTLSPAETQWINSNSKNWLEISGSGLSGKSTYAILDQSENEVKKGEFKFGKAKIDVSDIVSGTYKVVINSDGSDFERTLKLY